MNPSTALFIGPMDFQLSQSKSLISHKYGQFAQNKINLASKQANATKNTFFVKK